MHAGENVSFTYQCVPPLLLYIINHDCSAIDTSLNTSASYFWINLECTWMIVYSAYFLMKTSWSCKTSILCKSISFNSWTFNLTKSWRNICLINKTLLKKTNDNTIVTKTKVSFRLCHLKKLSQHEQHNSQQQLYILKHQITTTSK